MSSADHLDQTKSKMARLNSQTPSEVILQSTKREYGVYMHRQVPAMNTA
jgi:hypothetical protein